MRKTLLIFALIFSALPYKAAIRRVSTTYDAADCSRTEVLDKIALAIDGDTVRLPACSGAGATWSSTLAFSKAITLTGQACTLDANSRPTACTTIITNGINNGTVMLDVTLKADLTTRISNIEFAEGGGSHNATVKISGQTGGGTLDARRFRLDHNRFIQPTIYTPWIYAAYGVADHNYFDQIAIGPYFFEPAEYAWSDKRWADPPNLGGEDAAFFEDNTFIKQSGTVQNGTDSYGGARVVYRNNDFFNSHIDSHGTDSSGRARGTRMMEAYRNTFTMNNNSGYRVNIRSGAALSWGNVSTGGTGGGTVNSGVLNVERTFINNDNINVADGTSPWDVNNAGNPQATHTVTSATYDGSAFGTITVAGAGWDASNGGQWKSYSVHKVGCIDHSVTLQCGAFITANTATVLTFEAFHTLGLTGGDTITINKIDQIYDSPCRGQGTLLSVQAISSLTSVGTTASATVAGNAYSGNISIAQASPTVYRGTFPLTSTGSTFTYTMATTGATGSNGYATAVPATNDQVTEQCYQWLNTESGVNANFTLVATTSMRLNEHYYNYGGTVQSSATTPFSGATGVGVGTKVSPNYRPTTCTTGVAYWATDEGEWDSTNGATPDGQLYTCTATNTWTLSYTPYTYPHPLTAGDDATPPVPGDSGTLAASSESYTTLTLDWTEADDAVTAQSSLQYEVRRSLSNNIGTVANAEANGTIAQAYTADIDTANITGLSPATTYYFTVIVKDAAGNREVYDTVSATTLTDSTAPTPGNSGTITTASVSTASLTLNWTAATDAVTAQASLQYEVCRSTSNNVSDVTNCELRTIIQSFTANIVTLPVTALTCGTNYYFNVVVRDASLNKQAYTAKSQATSACPTTGKAGKLKGRGGR